MGYIVFSVLLDILLSPRNTKESILFFLELNTCTVMVTPMLQRTGTMSNCVITHRLYLMFKTTHFKEVYLNLKSEKVTFFPVFFPATT